MTFQQYALKSQSVFQSIEVLLGKQETFQTQIRLIDKKLKAICCADCQNRFKRKRNEINEQLEQVHNRMWKLIGILNKAKGSSN